MWNQLLCFFKEEKGWSTIEYLIGTAVLAATAYVCRNYLSSALKVGHDAMVNNITKITGN
ncbi:MAG: hypothetical protein HPY90_05505 [Syntrophothermus sp.]|uniref:hypothetical protein n=1 Tax=Syntrophothermus sp. TaxID=2736299 RepID=UPI00257D178B|nr:hypothetical protein [Syntrophothermus sp.]NSW82720.1 hypothetical protein [Syntrophothermus sp.]